jgi:hypothetical protein
MRASKSEVLRPREWTLTFLQLFSIQRYERQRYLVLSDHEWRGPLGLKVQNSNGSLQGNRLVYHKLIVFSLRVQTSITKWQPLEITSLVLLIIASQNPVQLQHKASNRLVTLPFWVISFPCIFNGVGDFRFRMPSFYHSSRGAILIVENCCIGSGMAGPEHVLDYCDCLHGNVLLPLDGQHFIGWFTTSKETRSRCCEQQGSVFMMAFVATNRSQ